METKHRPKNRVDVRKSMEESASLRSFVSSPKSSFILCQFKSHVKSRRPQSFFLNDNIEQFVRRIKHYVALLSAIKKGLQNSRPRFSRKKIEPYFAEERHHL